MMHACLPRRGLYGMTAAAVVLKFAPKQRVAYFPSLVLSVLFCALLVPVWSAFLLVIFSILSVRFELNKHFVCWVLFSVFLSAWVCVGNIASPDTQQAGVYKCLLHMHVLYAFHKACRTKWQLRLFCSGFEMHV